MKSNLTHFVNSYKIRPKLYSYISLLQPSLFFTYVTAFYIGLSYIQGGRDISAIVVTDDYLCYEEPKIPYNFFSYFII